MVDGKPTKSAMVDASASNTHTKLVELTVDNPPEVNSGAVSPKKLDFVHFQLPYVTLGPTKEKGE